MSLSPCHRDVPLAERAVVEVARELLEARLHLVWQQLELVHRDEGKSPREVHQLRVATRRAVAALDLFQPLLLPGLDRWFRKRLRRIRRTAGKARDLDVLAERLVGDAWPAEQPDCEHETHTDPRIVDRAAKDRARLAEMLTRRKERCRRPLGQLAADLLKLGEWSQPADGLVAGENEDDPESFRSFASRRLRPVVKRFFRAAARRLKKADELHELRIRGKRLRYALELCRPVFAEEAWQPAVSGLEKLQETLGGFTDHVAAADRLDRWARDATMSRRRLLARLSRDERRAARAARAAFVDWWTPSRRRRLRRQCERLLRGVST